MTDIELILTMLAEATTTKLHRDRDSRGFEPLKKDAQDGGAVAGRTRKDIEEKSGAGCFRGEFKGVDGEGAGEAGAVDARDRKIEKNVPRDSPKRTSREIPLF